MKIAILIFSLITGSVVQMLMPTLHFFAQTKPPILLAVFLHFALLEKRNFMLATGLSAGLLQDTLGMIPLGYSSAIFCLIGMGVQRWKPTLYEHSYSTHIFVGAASSAAMTLGLYILLVSGRAFDMSFSVLLFKVAGSLVLGAITMPLVMFFLSRLETKLGVERQRERYL